MKTISAENVFNSINNAENIFLIDVREKDEYDSGHIKNALLLPLGDVKLKAQNVLPDKNKKIIVYCKSGRRAEMAAKELQSMGYTDVYNLGGILDWQYEVIKD